MRRIVLFAAAIMSAGFTVSAQAQDVTVGSLKISTPWTRVTPKGASVGGGYLSITNTGATADRLVSGSSDVAGRFEIHEMAMDGGVMKMRMLSKGLEIPPGKTVELKPGGYHVMFMALKQPIEQGKPVKATLVFEKAGKVELTFSVQGIGAQAPGGGHSMPGMKH